MNITYNTKEDLPDEKCIKLIWNRNKIEMLSAIMDVMFKNKTFVVNNIFKQRDFQNNYKNYASLILYPISYGRYFYWMTV